MKQTLSQKLLQETKEGIIGLIKMIILQEYITLKNIYVPNSRVPTVYETTIERIEGRNSYFTFTNGQKNEKIDKEMEYLNILDQLDLIDM